MVKSIVINIVALIRFSRPTNTLTNEGAKIFEWAWLLGDASLFTAEINLLLHEPQFWKQHDFYGDFGMRPHNYFFNEMNPVILNYVVQL